MIHGFVIKLIERVLRMSIGINECTSLVFMLVSFVTSIMFVAAIYHIWNIRPEVFFKGCISGVVL
jgi:hypothetical protein